MTDKSMSQCHLIELMMSSRHVVNHISNHNQAILGVALKVVDFHNVTLYTAFVAAF